jgi:hypothetical protein
LGGDPALPELDEVQYVADAWNACGRHHVGVSGPIRIPASELNAWQHGAERTLAPWEFCAVLEMSAEFCAGYYEGETPECAPPYAPAAEAFDREIVSNNIRSFFGNLIKKAPK